MLKVCKIEVIKMSKANLNVSMDGEIVEILQEFCRWTGRDINEYMEEVIVGALFGDLDEMKNSAPKAEELLKRLCETTGYAVLIPVEDIQKIVEVALMKRLEELRDKDVV